MIEQHQGRVVREGIEPGCCIDGIETHPILLSIGATALARHTAWSVGKATRLGDERRPIDARADRGEFSDSTLRRQKAGGALFMSSFGAQFAGPKLA